MNRNLPKIAYSILRFLLPKKERDYLLPIYENIFYDLQGTKGMAAARFWFWRQIFIATPSILGNEFYWNVVMIKNYFTTTYRNLVKSKVYSFINLFGLSISITAVIFIALYLHFHLTFDDFHQYGDEIYRISIRSFQKGTEEWDIPYSVPPIGPELVREFPQVIDYTRIRIPLTENIGYKENSYSISNVLFADSTFFRVFSFELLEGNKTAALKTPFSIVLSQTTANKIFGNVAPIGKVLTIDGNDYIVTGVAADAPQNSSITFNALISFETLFNLPNMYMDWKGGYQYETFIRISENTTKESVEALFPDFLWKNINAEYAEYDTVLKAYLQPIKDIYLYYSYSSQDLRINLYAFSTIGLFILIIAYINFVNLSTARGSRRFLEIGVRKMLGATRERLIFQFLFESVFLCTIAVIGAVGLVVIILFVLDYFSLVTFTFQSIFNYKILLGVVGFVLLAGFSAGFYPAVILSKFEPTRIFHSSLSEKKRKITLNGVLVVLQFTIAISLVIMTLFINNQLSFIKTKELGFNKDNVVVVPITSDYLLSNVGAVQEELLSKPEILNVSLSSRLPNTNNYASYFIPEGYNNQLLINELITDENFMTTYGVELVEGRNFYKLANGYEKSVIINESLAKLLNWKSPVGKKIFRNISYTVIGVVKDFNFAPLYYKIDPLIILNQPVRQSGYLSIKIDADKYDKAVQDIRNIIKTNFSNQVVECQFLDETINAAYCNEYQTSYTLVAFSVLAIVIALLGLFGLTTYTLEQKYREIAIRKVHGASTVDLCLLLTWRFLIWVIIANIFAWPVTYLIITKWLENFAYKSEIGLSVFVFSGIIALLLALLTIGYHTYNVAGKNPAESIKYE